MHDACQGLRTCAKTQMPCVQAHMHTSKCACMQACTPSHRCARTHAQTHTHTQMLIYIAPSCTHACACCRCCPTGPAWCCWECRDLRMRSPSSRHPRPLKQSRLPRPSKRSPPPPALRLRQRQPLLVRARPVQRAAAVARGTSSCCIPPGRWRQGRVGRAAVTPRRAATASAV